MNIVMPVFNHLLTTQKTVESLLANTGDFRLILIDDGSTDDSWEYANELLAKLGPDRFHCHRHETNRGVNPSWNTGVRIAKAIDPNQDIVIANNDLLFTPNWDKPLKQALENPKVGVVSPLSTFGPTPRDWPNGMNRAPNPAGYLGYMPILGACFAVRGTLFDEIGLFPEECKIYWGDNWIALAAQSKGYKCGYVNSYIHHMFCQTTSKLNNHAIWPQESPIFEKIAATYKPMEPFVQKCESWQEKMKTWMN